MKTLFSPFLAGFSALCVLCFLTSCTEYSAQLQAKDILSAPVHAADPAIACAGVIYPDNVKTGVLWVMNADGTNKTVLYTAPSSKSSPALIGEPTWSPNGKHIAFTQITGGYENGAATGLFICDITNVNGKPTMQNKTLLVPGISWTTHIAWNPNAINNEIAFAAGETNDSMQMIKTISLAGGKPTVLFTAPASHSVSCPSYSPDGSQLAFEEIDNSVAPAKYSIVIVDRATGTVKESIVIHSVNAPEHLQWCHNKGGTQIAFGAVFAEGTCGVFTVNAENPKAVPMQILSPSAQYGSLSTPPPFAWSPDDSTLLIGNTLSGKLGLLDISNETVSTLTVTTDGTSQFDWRRF